MLRQIDKLVSQGESFCFETTLAGHGYARMIPQWRGIGVAAHLLFLTLPDAEAAIARVAARAAQGGHLIPEDIIRRGFTAGLQNFHSVYINVTPLRYETFFARRLLWNCKPL
jgi:predicted ABC-type ATPase